ncbi:CDC42 small effector protein 2-like isoform X2 [Styela clava]
MGFKCILKDINDSENGGTLLFHNQDRDMAEMWLCFPCCMSNDTSSNRRPRRKKIDPSMIGAPQNFVHLNHIGSGEPTGSDMQDHMQSKGGYEEKSDVNVQRKLDDVRPEGS